MQLTGDLVALDTGLQLREVEERALDTRPTLGTGWNSIDRLLFRRGMSRGEFCILTGRTGTRKTTVTANLIRNQLAAGRSVGLIGLDESVANYVGKVMSAITDVPREDIEEQWNEPLGRQAREQYAEAASRLMVSKGSRPTFEGLTNWLHYAEDELMTKVDVVFIDYVSLMTRDRYAGADVQRITRLIEDLCVWTNQHELVTIALHQVGRMDEGKGAGARYHGDTPMSLAGMKFGGEEVADYVLATYRPARDPVGHMSLEDALAYFPDSWKEDRATEVWERSVERVRKYKHSTFLQLLKNRPGTETCEEGVELLSPTTSMRMVEAPDRLGADMKHHVPEEVSA